MANIRVDALTEVTTIADDDVVMVDGKQGVRATTWGTLKNLIKQQCGINELNTKISDGGEGYVRLPDGTMIQHGFFAGSLVTNSNKNATRMVTFPYEFAKTGLISVVLTPDTSSYQNGMMFDSLTYTGFRAILMGALAASTSYPSGFRWVAIGRWK